MAIFPDELERLELSGSDISSWVAPDEIGCPSTRVAAALGVVLAMLFPVKMLAASASVGTTIASSVHGPSL
jgi:hypothetical protein